MKKTLFRLRRATAFTQAGAAGPGATDAVPRSAFFSTTLATRGLMRVNTPLVPWQARAIEIGAVEGALSGLAMALMGLATALLVPLMERYLY